MQLSELLSGINYIDVKGKYGFEHIFLVMRFASSKKDGLFFCLEGTQTDGHIFAPKAVADGAVALVCGRDVNLADDSVCRIIVSDTRAVMSKMAKTFFTAPAICLILSAWLAQTAKPPPHILLTPY